RLPPTDLNPRVYTEETGIIFQTQLVKHAGSQASAIPHARDDRRAAPPDSMRDARQDAATLTTIDTNARQDAATLTTIDTTARQDASTLAAIDTNARQDARKLTAVCSDRF